MSYFVTRGCAYIASGVQLLGLMLSSMHKSAVMIVLASFSICAGHLANLTDSLFLSFASNII